MTDKTADIVIAGAARTPMGAFQGELAPLAAPELGGAAIAGAIRNAGLDKACLLYTSPSPRDMRRSRMPSSA